MLVTNVAALHLLNPSDPEERRDIANAKVIAVVPDRGYVSDAAGNDVPVDYKAVRVDVGELGVDHLVADQKTIHDTGKDAEHAMHVMRDVGIDDDWGAAFDWPSSTQPNNP